MTTFVSHPTLPIEVSADGQVRNPRTGNVLKPYERGGRPGNRYFGVSIGRSKAYLHTLVAETFIGARPEGCEPDHVDGDHSNNAATNLRWLDVYTNRTRHYRSEGALA